MNPVFPKILLASSVMEPPSTKLLDQVFTDEQWLNTYLKIELIHPRIFSDRAIAKTILLNGLRCSITGSDYPQQSDISPLFNLKTTIGLV
jgi:hypothetical protein